MTRWLALLALAGCSVATPPPKAEPVIQRPIRANACVADWYATATLPDCAEEWINELAAQQATIDAEKKKPARAKRKGGKT